MGEGRTSGSFLKRVVLLLCSASAAALVLLYLMSVSQEGHTVPGSSLEVDGFEGGLIPSSLFFSTLFSPAGAAVGFG